MKKLICDRCGNDVKVPAFEEDRMPIIRFEIQREQHEPYKTVDLCTKCRDRLMEWLEGGNGESI